MKRIYIELIVVTLALAAGVVTLLSANLGFRNYRRESKNAIASWRQFRRGPVIRPHIKPEQGKRQEHRCGGLRPQCGYLSGTGDRHHGEPFAAPKHRALSGVPRHVFTPFRPSGGAIRNADPA